jgi:hypothetical protein
MTKGCVCHDLLTRLHAIRVFCLTLKRFMKPVTDEQVFYDKFLCDKFYLPSAHVYMYATHFIWQVFIWQVLFTDACERVRKRCLSLLWQKNYNSPLANHIKWSDYFDKFSLLTHTDKQNLYFDNFFYDKCTCSKASMLAFEQVHLS